MFVDGLITGDVGESTLGERLILSSGFVAVTVVVQRGTGRVAALPHLHPAASPRTPRRSSRWVQKVEAELESLAAENVTDPVRIAQAVRRTVGKWVGRRIAASR